MGGEIGFLDLGQPQVIFDDALQVAFDSIANKLHVQHLHRWSTVIAQALEAPVNRAQVTRLEAAE
jgi:hypothetical protein